MEKRIYNPSEAVVFYKTREEYGELSNMASGFPIEFNNIIRIPSSEALYQMMRYTEYPDIQFEIANTNSAMAAKMKSKKYTSLTRKDWRRKRVVIMRWCLNMKYIANRNRFGPILRATKNLEIVEKSKKDDFWGAIEVGDQLIGQNILGRLLVELRSDIYNEKEVKIYIPNVPELKIFGVDLNILCQSRSDGNEEKHKVFSLFESNLRRNSLVD